MNRNASKWIDCMVQATDGDVGNVVQLYFDDLTWSVRYLAVSMEGPAGRHALLSLATLGKPDWDRRVLPANLTLAQVSNSPNADINEPVSRQYEVALHEHYAWPFYWGGGFYALPEYDLAAVFAREAKMAAEALSIRVRKIDPHLRSTREVMGCLVHASDGNIGHVEDFLVDDETRIIRYLVVNTRKWLPNRRVLVAPQWISSVNWADGQIFVDLTREAVKQSPRFDPAKPVGPEYEDRLRDHLQKPVAREWVVFHIHAGPGAAVYVAGTFNNWDPAAIQLGDNGKGNYTAMVLLPTGRHEYKFIVNGQWRNGPECHEQVPNACGTTNSVLHVGHGTTRDVHAHTFSRHPDGEDSPMLGTWRND